MLGFELLEFVLQVLDVLFFALTKGALAGAILGPAANAHVRRCVFAVLGGGAGVLTVWLLGGLGLLRALPSGSVVGLDLGQVGEFDRIDDMRLWLRAVVVGTELI